MATFIDIKNRVRTRLIDLPAATLAEVPTLVNDALRELQDRHNFWVMQKTLTANTTADTRILAATPSDFKDFRLEPYYTDSVGTIVEMSVASSKRQVQGFFEADAEGLPQFILRGEPTTDAGASSLEVWPLSDSQSDYTVAPAGEYRISVPYWKYLPALSADGDTNWFTLNEQGVQYLINKATALGFAVNWDINKEAEWFALADRYYNMLVATDKQLWFGGQDTFTPHQGAWWNRNRVGNSCW
jgi:hypothetical protein